MVSAYHQAVKNAIVRYGQNHGKVQRVRQAGHLLHITHPTRALTIVYNPDVRFELRHSIIVFEVLDTQTEAKTIADIIRSFLAQNVTQVYFFVKNTQAEQDVSDLCDVILSKLADDFHTKKSKLPTNAKVVLITRVEANNQQTLDDAIREAIRI